MQSQSVSLVKNPQSGHIWVGKDLTVSETSKTMVLQTTSRGGQNFNRKTQRSNVRKSKKLKEFENLAEKLNETF